MTKEDSNLSAMVIEDKKVYCREWRLKNKERWLRYNQNFRKKHPEYMKEYMRKKRDKLKQEKLNKAIENIHEVLFHEKRGSD